MVDWMQMSFLTVVLLTFKFPEVLCKITRQNLRYNLNMKYAENKNSMRITKTIR